MAGRDSYTTCETFSQSSGKSFWNAAPFLFSNVILVDVNIISKSIQVAAEHQRGVHEGAGIHKFSPLSNLHFLDVEYETSIEDLLSDSTFSAKDHDFIVCNLVGKTHVSRDPMRLVDLKRSGATATCSYNFLPDIFGNIIAFNGINNILLINPTTKCENEVVLE